MAAGVASEGHPALRHGGHVIPRKGHAVERRRRHGKAKRRGKFTDGQAHRTIGQLLGGLYPTSGHQVPIGLEVDLAQNGEVHPADRSRMKRPSRLIPPEGGFGPDVVGGKKDGRGHPISFEHGQGCGEIVAIPVIERHQHRSTRQHPAPLDGTGDIIEGDGMEPLRQPSHLVGKLHRRRTGVSGVPDEPWIEMVGNAVIGKNREPAGAVRCRRKVPRPGAPLEAKKSSLEAAHHDTRPSETPECGRRLPRTLVTNCVRPTMVDGIGRSRASLDSLPLACFTMPPEMLPFTDNADANRLLATEPIALLIGMLLDQQFPMERAFFAPYLLRERLGGRLDVKTIAALDDAKVDALFAGPPALHRYPSSMGRRARDLCAFVMEEYAGKPARIWTEAADGADLLRRLEALPGYGKAKSRIFVGIVGKRLGLGPSGWEKTAADWASIADVDSFDKVAVLREQKRAMKAAKKTAAEG